MDGMATYHGRDLFPFPDIVDLRICPDSALADKAPDSDLYP